MTGRLPLQIVEAPAQIDHVVANEGYEALRRAQDLVEWRGPRRPGAGMAEVDGEDCQTELRRPRPERGRGLLGGATARLVHQASHRSPTPGNGKQGRDPG